MDITGLYVTVCLIEVLAVGNNLIEVGFMYKGSFFYIIVLQEFVVDLKINIFDLLRELVLSIIKVFSTLSFIGI